MKKISNEQNEQEKLSLTEHSEFSEKHFFVKRETKIGFGI